MSKDMLNREQIIEKFKKGSRAQRQLINTLTNLKKHDSFNTGDVLVARYENNGKYVLLNEELQVKQKYLVVHKEDPGVVFCQAINKSGKLSPKIMVLAEHNLHFELDPDLASAIILDDQENYDAFSQVKDYRRKVDEVKKYNKKIALKWETPEELLAILGTLKKGQTMWVSTVWEVDLQSSECIIEEVGTPNTDYSVIKNSYGGGTRIADAEWIDAGFKTKKPLLKVKYNRYTYSDTMSLYRFKKYNFFVEKPKTVSEVAS